MNPDQPVDAACPQCGKKEFYEWEVDAGGGWSPKMLPLSLLDGAKCRLRCCLACGNIQWFATPDALADLREKKARGK